MQLTILPYPIISRWYNYCGLYQKWSGTRVQGPLWTPSGSGTVSIVSARDGGWFQKNEATSSICLSVEEDIEVVHSYKYLGVHLNSKPDWAVHANSQYKEGKSWVYFLKKLKSFSVCNEMLYMFYQFVVPNLFFYVVCWGNGLTVRDSNQQDKLIRTCLSVRDGAWWKEYDAGQLQQHQPSFVPASWAES